jgi:FAD-dependent oxidoreductase domain-containing protein 1
MSTSVFADASLNADAANKLPETHASEVHDVLIVGGGVIGSAIAYFLAAEHGVRATVVERDPTYAKASSALSASSIRQQFSTPANIALSQWSFRFLKEAHARLAVPGEAPPLLSLEERGYLYLASEQGIETLRENYAVQIAHGADIRWLNRQALQHQFPWLACDDIVAGVWGASGEGWFDGPALLQAFRRKAISLGVRYVQDEIVAIQHDSSCSNVIGRTDKKSYFSKTIILSTGAHFLRAMPPEVCELPIAAKKRDVFVFESPAALPACPLVIDPSGFWFRPEGRFFICGAPPRERDGLPFDPDDAPLDDIDYGLFDEVIWPALAARVPQFEALKLRSAWAGYYEMNTFDHNGLVGALPGVDNLFVACGFSGHGMQHAPAIGHAMAKLVMGQAAPEIAALTPLRLERNQRVVEKNVI